MRYLIIFLIFLALLAWVGYRYRRQIAVARQVWQMLLAANKARQQQQTGVAQPQKKTQQVASEKLVRCEKCETWIPRDTAISFGGKNYFCSVKCMERSVVNS